MGVRGAAPAREEQPEEGGGWRLGGCARKRERARARERRRTRRDGGRQEGGNGEGRVKDEGKWKRSNSNVSVGIKALEIFQLEEFSKIRSGMICCNMKNFLHYSWLMQL